MATGHGGHVGVRHSLGTSIVGQLGQETTGPITMERVLVSTAITNFLILSHFDLASVYRTYSSYITTGVHTRLLFN